MVSCRVKWSGVHGLVWCPLVRSGVRGCVTVPSSAWVVVFCISLFGVVVPSSPSFSCTSHFLCIFILCWCSFLFFWLSLLITYCFLIFSFLHFLQTWCCFFFVLFCSLFSHFWLLQRSISSAEGEPRGEPNEEGDGNAERLEAWRRRRKRTVGGVEGPVGGERLFLLTFESVVSYGDKRGSGPVRLHEQPQLCEEWTILCAHWSGSLVSRTYEAVRTNSWQFAAFFRDTVGGTLYCSRGSGQASLPRVLGPPCQPALLLILALVRHLWRTWCRFGAPSILCQFFLCVRRKSRSHCGERAKNCMEWICDRSFKKRSKSTRRLCQRGTSSSGVALKCVDWVTVIPLQRADWISRRHAGFEGLFVACLQQRWVAQQLVSWSHLVDNRRLALE